MDNVTYSLVIPVYRNEASIPDLLQALQKISTQLKAPMEVIFVVDGSPDGSYAVLKQHLPYAPFASQLVTHSRNFGAFAAIKTGIEQARGAFTGIMAADLQEPPELIVEMFGTLEKGDVDIVIGARRRRSDPILSRIYSALFWSVYRRWVQPDMPMGGVDVFACNRAFADCLISMKEANTTLVGLAVWMGFRRTILLYDRMPRKKGASAWTFRRKWSYVMDSYFAFSDLPIQLLTFMGAIGMGLSLVLGFIVLHAKLYRDIPVPGYTATILAVMFFGGLNSFGLGILGGYVWRAFENSKGRPSSIVMRKEQFGR